MIHSAHEFKFRVKRNKLNAQHAQVFHFVLTLMIITMKLLVLHTFAITFTSPIHERVKRLRQKTLKMNK